MEILVTSDEMRLCDRAAVERYRIPSLLLMENAGAGAARVLEEQFGPVEGKLIYVFCGKGNNGGDGFVVARHLYNLGARVWVFLTGRASELRGDAKTNHQILKEIVRHDRSKNITFDELHSTKPLSRLPKPHIIVDALVGTGFTGSLRDPYRQLVEWMNRTRVPTLAIDVPSGINSDNGTAGNAAVRADVTATMALKKVGLVVNRGRECAGRTIAVDIQIPSHAFQSVSFKTFLIEPADVIQRLPQRPLSAHKYSCGKVFVVAGSVGLTGAAAMCSSSALKAGAGAVVLGIPQSLNAILEEKLTEVMTVPLPETSDQSLAANAYDVLKRNIEWSDVVALGPGLSRNRETQQLVWRILENINRPILVDADGLNALSENRRLLKRKKTVPFILTPHAGELSRLIGLDSKEIEAERVSVAREVAKNYRVVLVLKGGPTVVADAEGNVYVNSTGNPGMATAGAGDVLSGIIVGLWAQGLSPLDAALCGVYLHGLAGDLARDALGEYSLVAMDIQEQFPNAVRELYRRIGDSGR